MSHALAGHGIPDELRPGRAQQPDRGAALWSAAALDAYT